MAIVNRTLDVSEKRKVMQQNLGLVATGVTAIVAAVPYACTLDAMQIIACGLSGAPTYQLNVDRFIVGTGFTTIILATGTSNTPGAYGTSGVLAAKLVASGSTLLNLLANDLLMVTSGVANTAALSLSVSVVLKPISDVKTQFGV